MALNIKVSSSKTGGRLLRFLPSQEFMRQVGNVEIPQRAFMAVLQLND